MEEPVLARPAAATSTCAFVGLSSGAVALVLLSACADRGEDATVLEGGLARCEALAEAGGFAVAESAGVRVVTNASPQWTDAERLAVSAEAAVIIGVRHGAAAQEFGDISDGAMLSDGRIVVADAQTGELRVFDADGRFLRTVGGQGSGPGEFRTISGIHRVSGDTLLVDDQRARRVTRLSPELEVIDVTSIPPVVYETPPASPGERPTTIRSSQRILGAFADGTLLASQSGNSRTRPAITIVYRDSLLLRHVGSDGQPIDSIGTVLGVQRFEYFSPGGSVVFGDAILGFAESIAVAGDVFYAGTAETFEIEARGADGRLDAVIRICESADSVDTELLDRAVQARLAGFPEEELALEAEALQGIPLPAVAPSFLRMLVDTESRLWVQDFTYPGDPQLWKVISRDGRWLGDVRLPTDDTVLDIAHDVILTRHTDELGVASVRIYNVENR